jgi:arsenical pump membrane protein
MDGPPPCSPPGLTCYRIGRYKPMAVPFDLITLAIFLATIVLSLTQPTIGRWRLHHGWVAMLGALLMLALLPLPLVHSVISSLKILVRPIVTIISLMIITLVAEQAGLFHRVMRGIVALAGGSGKKLFFWLFVVGALTGSIFTNDAAVLILTPLVCVMSRQWMGLRPIPYLFAVLNIANLVAAFVISNPINIVVADYFGIDFLEYAAWMALPAIVAAISTYLVLRVIFAREIAASRVAGDGDLSVSGGHPAFIRVCAVVIVMMLAAALLGPLAGLPLWVVTATGALLLMGWGRLAARIDPVVVVRHVAWDVLFFVAGFFMIVNGLRATGVTALIGAVIGHAAAQGTGLLILTSGFMAAICSALMNNHPTAYLMALAIGDLGVSPATQKVLAFAVLIGGDLGPKMLPIGSLAALLWFQILREHDIHVPYSLYVKIGLPVTLIALALALSVLAAEVYLVGL